MRLSPIFLLLVLTLLLAARQPQTSGVKMTVRSNVFGRSSEQTSYWEADRRRLDYQNSSGNAMGPHIAQIDRCDLGEAYELNLEAFEYDKSAFPPKPLTPEQMAARRLPAQSLPMPANKTLRIETTTVDTGERKAMFGHTARHVITTRKQTPLEGSHLSAQQSTTDGWYIDLDTRISCDFKFPSGGHAYGYLAPEQPWVAPENPEFVEVGKPEIGFALQLEESSNNDFKAPDRTLRHNSTKFEKVVTEMYEGPLDPSLFEVPRNFKQVSQIDANTPVSQLQSFWDRFAAGLDSYF
jgi:hypothetical protein